ncbi:MAG: V-type ATP synthase subunit E [Verrucomicrobia bacterium]|nr:V-type ATP synthase subunit E [Verrucomicrobiota bacterium]
MKNLETGKDKVKKICDILRKETLEPAKLEADDILAKARREAEEILADAEARAEEMIAHARSDIERQKTVFQASLSQACRQAIDLLKEKIENKLFHPQLLKLLSAPLQDPNVIAKLIAAVVEGIDKQGIDTDLTVQIASTVPARAVNELLAKEIVSRLKEKGVLLSTIGGGIEVKLVKDNITIELSDVALKEMVAEYIRKDFRDLVMGA